MFYFNMSKLFLPWMERVIDEEVEDNVIEDVLQTFHLILLSSSEVQSQIFANALLSSCWFTLSFKYLGLFQTDQMRTTVYLSIASLIDRAFGPDFGQPVRDACVFLPFDPLELVFLLGQKHSLYPELPLCQCAAILILYVTSLSGERLADDAQVLASLEQYILVNCRNFLSATGNYLILALVLHLYGLLRCSPAGINWPYSREAEETLFILLAKDEVDLLCIEVHPMALEWLFQQEGFMAFLSHQILRFCRFLGPNETLLIVHQYGRKTINMQMISELVVSGDNYVAPLLVSLLKELQEEGAEDDMLCVLNTMAGILQKFPNASIQFCLHNVAGTVRSIYYSKYCSSQLFAACSLLVFNILHTANHKVISQDEEWHAVTIKVLNISLDTIHRLFLF
ncbi:hypothetical protein HPP92_024560 [Vanilla planifolia]|uniref:Uncharacterized protein n=1 Tax=Vanilla planifolia TaxID=51239 RepID=A0A835PQ14_VANPL|nr:hypothetical protein HPP92_024560 [Vanilla planifolia]